MKNYFSQYLLFFVVSILSYDAVAYPLFYTCQNEELKYSEKIDTEDLFEKIIAMDSNEQKELSRFWCKGVAGCVENLKTIISFSNASYKIAEELFLAEIKKINQSMDAKVSDSNISLLKSIASIKDSYSKLQACQNTSSMLTPDDFIYNGKLLTAYPYHTNYMYITGCKSVNTRSCKPMEKENVDRVIRESIAMNVDPYLTIALTLMEEGTSIGNLYLDPIGVMDAVGCSGKQLSNVTKEDAFYSYGTSYKLTPSLKKNFKLSKRLEAFLKLDESTKIDKGKSYYCYDILGESKPSIFDKAQSNSCCLQLNFNTSQKATKKISHGLTYEYINKITKNDFRKKTGPEWKAQRFNGYSNLMGGAESVPSWRIGVNYFENPGYGQQVMDYIINSLMFNPYIANKVNEESQASDQSWKSILCRKKKNGTYYHDSEKYINLLKKSKRLGVILEKYNKGIQYKELTDREIDVINRELRETAALNSKMPILLSEGVKNSYLKEILNDIGVGKKDLFNKTELDPNELWSKLSGDAKITRNEFNQIISFLKKSDKIQKEQQVITDQLVNSQVDHFATCTPMYSKYTSMYAKANVDYAAAAVVYQQYIKCTEDAKKMLLIISADSLSMAKEYEVDKESQFNSLQVKLFTLLTQRLDIEQKYKSTYKGAEYFKYMKIYSKDKNVVQNLMTQRFQYESLPSALQRLENY
ncbi:MAG: hypothetical protein HON90_02390, partial [Halobacteriovoraceae bacterium]|nr:hypothetical protein [Halobacteriovoraceae bacterium]